LKIILWLKIPNNEIKKELRQSKSMDLTLELYRRDLIIDEELILIGKKCTKMKSFSIDCKDIFVKKNVFEIFGEFHVIRKR